MVIQKNIEKAKTTITTRRSMIYFHNKTEKYKEKKSKKKCIKLCEVPPPIIVIPKMVKVTRTNISITV